MGKTLIPGWSDCVIGVVVIILFCVTLLLNILALHYTYSKIRKPSNKKIPHLLVGALSLAGLGIAVFEYPPFIASRFNGQWLYNSGVCNFVAFIIVLFGNLTICLVVLMSLERLGAIVFPFFYKEYVNFRRAVIILLFIIGYSILLASLPLFLDQIRLNVSTGICTYAVDSYNTNTKIIVAVMVTHYIASIIIMFISNMVVVKTVSQLDRNTMSGEYENRCGERKHSSHACLNFAKMVGVLAFCYTICWTVILMRILLMYVYGWRNFYYDQVVIILTTFDPLINHCVCLWIMRKYRDGYASSMGSLMSCFKISDDGIWATTITRLSTISRRSTYSRASTRSSSRQSSKPYFYKQVPQNAENQPQDVFPDGEEVPDQIVKNNVDIQEDKLSDKLRIASEGKREWSEIIRELKAEKENIEHDSSSDKSSCKSPDKIKVLEGGALHDPQQSKRETARNQWRKAFKKIKARKKGVKDTNTGVPQGSILGPSGSKKPGILATVPEKRENTSIASGAEADLGSQKAESLENLKRPLSDDVGAEEEWTKIIQKLNNKAAPEPSSREEQMNPRDSSGHEASLPELLREIKTPTVKEQQPEFLKDSAHAQTERAGPLSGDLPEIVQVSSVQHDDSTSSRQQINLETNAGSSDQSQQQNQAQNLEGTNLEEKKEN